jgi:hypothetical protein
MATFTPQLPRTRPLEATAPLDLALGGLGTLVKLTSVTGITVIEIIYRRLLRTFRSRTEGDLSSAHENHRGFASPSPLAFMSSTQFQIVSDVHLETHPSYDGFKLRKTVEYLALLGDVSHIGDDPFLFLEKQV